MLVTFRFLYPHVPEVRFAAQMGGTADEIDAVIREILDAYKEGSRISIVDKNGGRRLLFPGAVSVWASVESA